MKEFKGTGGVWIEECGSIYGDAEVICNNVHDKYNSALIIAAPDLLQALQNLLGSLNSYDENDQDAIKQAEAAISKALSINN